MFNKIIIGGNLTKDPDLRTVATAQGNIPVCNLSVATNDWRQPHDEQGNVVPQFFNIAVWREHANACAQYLAKGRPVIIEGSVALRRQEVDGQVYTGLDIYGANVCFFGGTNNTQNVSVPANVTVAQPAQPAQSARRRARTQAAATAPAAPVQVPNYDVAPPADMQYTTVEDDELPF